MTDILSEEKWTVMSKIINGTEPGGGPGHLRVKRFRRGAEKSLTEAGYTPEEIDAAWNRHWKMMSELVAKARAA